jgi:hypothetical protein
MNCALGKRTRHRRHTWLAAAIVTALLAAGCAIPIRAQRVDARRVHRQLTSNVLTTGELSQATRNVLYVSDLVARYEDDPRGALAAAHAALVAGTLQPQELAALAELAFHHAEHGGGRPYFLASALYAWAYLFPNDERVAPDAFDPRFRLACDLYNRGVTAGLMAADGQTVDLRPATLSLPFGVLDVAFDPARLRWREYVLVDFVPIAELEVVGLQTVHRWPGLGAPLAAGIAPDTVVKDDLLAPRARYPVTALLRFTDLHEQLRSDRIQSTLEVYPGFGEQTVTIDGRSVPLEAEPTAALALGLDNPAMWARERAGFLRGMGVITEQTRLVSLRPYQPGLIPVVFVHGTASSAGRWAELYNELDNDPRIHDRYQFWSFSYETGNPIAYSAMLLRESLEHAVARVDPEGRDPALRQMVVVGHSQGGLLTKAMVVEPGTALWNNVSSEPIDELDLEEGTRDLLRRALLFHPLPFVRRVVFIATPHHGSYIAGNWLAHQVARLVKFPLDLSNVFTDLVVRNQEATVRGQLRPKGVPSSVDNMTPGNPFVKTMAELPVAPGVAAHSIVAVKDDRPPLDNAADGVVAYKSAHLDGVDSECVVLSSHSCQSNPHTIAEVRRILLLHLETAEAAGVKPPPPLR